MLKHVAACRSRADTMSLSSTTSYGSTVSHDDLFSSRSSSTCSLQDNASTITTITMTTPSHQQLLQQQQQQQRSYTVPVKVYANVLRSDIEYKTLSLRPGASSREIVASVLGKYRMKHRDPNLFYLTMEVGVRKTGLPVRTILVLDDEAKPVELQACHPVGHSKFSLQMRRGGLVKVYDGCLMSGSQYKSLLISERTTVDELVQLLLNCYNLNELKPNKFSLFEVSKTSRYERKLHPDDYPLLVQHEWPNRDQYAFHLRRNPETINRRRVPWTMSLDTSGQVNYRLTLRDEVNPRILHSPTLKPSYNDYENYFYI